jgi:ABC-2 type transport system permease protein
MISKMQGNIVDLLMVPLTPAELVVGYALACVTRGVAVGAACAFGIAIFVPLPIVDLGMILYHATMASLMLGLLGLLAGIWADKFDHIAAVTNFVVTPAAFLSGTFYSIERLPAVWNAIAHANPLFYLIDGLRYGFTGYADGPLAVGAIVVAIVNLALWIGCQTMLDRGYKLKA